MFVNTVGTKAPSKESARIAFIARDVMLHECLAWHKRVLGLMAPMPISVACAAHAIHIEPVT